MVATSGLDEREDVFRAELDEAPIEPMTPHELLEIVSGALGTTGVPFWTRPDGEDEVDALVFADDVCEPASTAWALVTVPARIGGDIGARVMIDRDRIEVDGGSVPQTIDADECVFVDVGLAEALIADHLASWLLARAWQVQVSVHRGAQHWRLADCLSFVEGGGDRLDDDYPHGDDRLSVLCESVAVVADAAVQGIRRAVGPV